MVSFNCDGCGDVVKKPKLLQHFNRCWAPVTCLDCSKQFNSPDEFKPHNTCVSEAEKYERSVYRGPKHNQQQPANGVNGTPSKQQQQQQQQQPKPAQPEMAAEAQQKNDTDESPRKEKKDKKDKKRKRDEEVETAGPVAEASSSSPTNAGEKKEKKDKKDKKEKKDKKSKKSKTEDGDGVNGQDIGNDDEEEDENEHEQDDPMQAAAEEAKVLKPLSSSELEAFKKKQRKLGIVYISRIPPGMTPAKVRHIVSNFGEIGRLYLQDGNETPGEGGSKKKRRGVAHYTEGWVEFLSKKVAKAAAETLNAQPIGGLAASNSKKSGTGGGSNKMGKSSKRFQDDVWTLKYLKGFKWHMLSEQMAQERASHTARLRTELSQSAFEQADYLKKVERARIQDKKAERRKTKANDADESTPATDDNNTGREKVRTFKQRQPVTKDVRDIAQQA